MNKNELIKNLKKDIQDIYSKINDFEKSDQIHLIDLDLTLSKVRNLYELLSKLNHQETYTPEYQKEEISTITEQKEKKEEIEKNTEIEKTTDQAEEVIESSDNKTEPETPVREPELIIETPTKKEIITTEPVEKNEETIEKTEILQEAKQNETPEIVADKFQSKKFIHDSLAKKNIKDVSSKMQSKPINDINNAIGLNDKFIFIRELFGNNKELYHETIQVLNNFDTFENAVTFLNENFDWAEDDTNFERLKELVRRKYL